MSEKKKFYITTSIPYLNAKPHLGFALEAVQADVIARYQRAQGKDTFFLSGADEHGAKIARSAEAAGKSPREFVDAQVVHFTDLLKKLHISNNDFVRTSDEKRHWLGAQLLWEKMVAAGDIYKGNYRGLYCVGHEAFITEKDLDGEVCAIHKKPPEAIDEENYFFRLSKYVSFLKELIVSDKLCILPEFRKQEVLNMLDDPPAGGGDISFSRPAKDLSWGVPVPGDATQTMYVWCDALSNYITALGYGQPRENAERFFTWWPVDVHVIGKDIVRFHAIFWPAMLYSAGLPIPKTIFIHGFINNKGEKMSKSLGNVVDPLPLIEKYGRDAVRFYLLHEVATFGDSDYSEDHFHEVYEGSLVNGLGNLVSRVTKMIENVGGVLESKEDEWLQEVRGVEKISYHSNMEKYEIGTAIKTIWTVIRRLDSYIEQHKIYKLVKENPGEAKKMLGSLSGALGVVARMLAPCMPETSQKIISALQNPSERIHLFPRIEK